MTSRLLSAAALALLVALVGAGCGKGSPAAKGPPTLTVSSNAKLGRFLVVNGRTLYMYPPDRQRAVTCTAADDCRSAWPPLFVPPGRKAIAGPGVSPSLIGSIPGDGGRVVTYDHWPLYYYIGDRAAGDVNGQDQGFNWFVIAPDGHPTRTGPVSAN